MRISLFLTLLFLLSKNVYAYTCTFDSSAFTLSSATIYVDSSISAGEKIGQPITGNKTYMTCTDVSNITTQKFLVGARGVHLSGKDTSLLTYDKHFIYSTNISGIGFAVGSSVTNCGNNNTTSWVGKGSGMQNEIICQSYEGGTQYKTFSAIPTVQLYRTDESLGSGVINMPVGYLATTFNDKTPTVNGNSVNSAPFSINVTIRKSTCSISSDKNLTVKLPPISKTLFTELYSSAGDTSFTIDVKCDETTPVYVRFDSANINYANLGLLENEATGNDAASGVGIQLLKSDGYTPFRIGSNISVGKASNGNTSFSFFARYSQLAKTITPGKVKSTATFTLTYK